MSDECDCTIAKCDIFDFMAKHIGMTVIHPGGFKATILLADSLNITKESHVLDIACGKGTTAIYLTEKYGCRVTGIDISEDLLCEAKKLVGKRRTENRITFQIADAMKLPFPDNSFDVAVSQAILVLVEDKVKAIQEAHRVIKSGGKAGWLELSWRKEIDSDFLDKVSNVLCAYCMTNVNTYDGWIKIFKDAGICDLAVTRGKNVRGNILDELRDEGITNTIRIFHNILTNKEVRMRTRTMNRFFKEYDDYFGLGIYVFEK
jgi:SAM-dependent methyltransferase